MAIEDVKSFRGQLLNVKNKSVSGQTLRYDDALKLILRELESKKTEELREITSSSSEDVIVKDKNYLRKRKEIYRQYIYEIIQKENFKVVDYQDRMDEFIDEMVEETVGYSILGPAMSDPDVSDIYVITWDKIYVEKNGKNEKYPYTFRSEAHFNSVLTRLLDESGKTLNSGDNKIVDFELYGDRGNAIDKSVSPNGTSLTLRKHSDDHITRDQLVEWGVMTAEMADFLGMLIQGETNMICAGLTGSGKTTTVRALIDHYVPQVNKRMLVCEDTQELFPKNDHTLELVSIKHPDEDQAVPLNDLIMTALRQKPKYIVVGEVRGPEAEAAVEAMETGHSTIFTMHGGRTWNVINRIVTKYITSMPSLGKEVVERIIGSSLDYVFLQTNIPGIGRKITEITEIDYDYNENRISVKTIFKYDLINQEWIQLRGIDQEKADKIMERGVPVEEVQPWIEKAEVVKDVSIIKTMSLVDFQLRLLDENSLDEILNILKKQIGIVKINIYNYKGRWNYDIISTIKEQIETIDKCIVCAEEMGLSIPDSIKNSNNKLKNFNK